MSYSETLVQQVWEKARAYAEIDSGTWREDECGAWIRREEYGRTDSEFGWKIVNVSGGGPDTPDNLRPLHCLNGYDIANRRHIRHMAADRISMPVFEHNFEPRNRKVSS
ncbi:MAG TPA: hypothetical protein VKC56_00905 [Gallionellaceae bacterium]|nr:hypothetical protein [Gallionellaceae bacterium]